MLILFGDFDLDTDRRELKRHGELIPLEPQVFDLLVHLVANRDRVVSKDDLIASVWGGRIVSESTLTSRINSLRRAVGDSGERQQLVRTIARKGVRFVGEVREQRPPDPGNATALALPDRPSIAVLPFTDMSGGSEPDYFGDGMTEEIITALSRVRWFFVIARHSTFAYRNKGMDAKQIARELGVRYVLAGSVRRADDRIRVSAQLVEGASGNNVWARSYDRALSDIFVVQDEMTQTLVGAIEPELGRAERERARVKARDNLDAWSIYQRGMFHLYRCTREDLLEARRLFRQAIAIDPELGPAYSGEAEAYYYEVVYGFAQSNEENREKAIGPAHRAVTLDAEDAGAHCTLGRVRYLRREYPQAISELETALELNPSLALAHYGLGATLVFSGRPAESLSHLKAAIRLSPHDPNMGSFLVRIADAHYFAADYEGAVTFALKALGQPNFQWSRYAVLIAALGQLGRLDEARRYLEELTRQRPDFSIAFVQGTHLFGEQSLMAQYCEGLRKAGVPDRA
ncbi:MAG TPA: tetratricopeptide repeat protein [Burkholderiales bacterium]|nr:tetratricopeptide repeat protein [Burkholderiales bacterium]